MLILHDLRVRSLETRRRSQGEERQEVEEEGGWIPVVEEEGGSEVGRQ